MLQLPIGKRNHLYESGYTEEEQADIYDHQLDDIINNIRWYLDAVDFLYAYRVSFKNYRGGKKNKLKSGKMSLGTPTLPLKYVNKA